MSGIGSIAVLGAGAWGTALAQAARRAGREVTLWARDPATAATIARNRRSPRLPDVTLDEGVRITAELGEARGDALILAVPAQAVRAVVARLPRQRPPLVVAAKGFETTTGLRMTEVVAEGSRGRVAVLSGPSFAAEVARGQPTAVTIGCADPDLGRELALALGSTSFRCYWTNDVVGVEVGGAVKNVLAIAAGIVVGRGLGESARASLVARGLAELAGLGEALGAERTTLMGLSGLGDLVLTCTSPASRNFAYGRALGEGYPPPAALAEGVATAAAVVALADRHGQEMPICRAVAAVLGGRQDVDSAIQGLLRRVPKPEEPR